MRWYRDLYLGPSVSGELPKIRKKAALGVGMVGVYYITVSSVPGNLLDIFHNGMLKQPLFRKVQCKDIVGVAMGKQEAFGLAGTILMELYDKTKGFDIRSYFKEEDFEDD